MKLPDRTLGFIDLYQAQAEEYLHRSIESVDRVMGTGTAASNPQVVAAFMQAMSVHALGYSLDHIAGSISERAGQ